MDGQLQISGFQAFARLTCKLLRFLRHELTATNALGARQKLPFIGSELDVHPRPVAFLRNQTGRDLAHLKSRLSHIGDSVAPQDADNVGNSVQNCTATGSGRHIGSATEQFRL
jgi:hypothetical protein